MFKQLFGAGSSPRGYSGFPVGDLVNLNDVSPHSYTGKADHVLVVNGTANGITFVLGRGVANGFASLDASGLLPNTQLPPLAISEYLGSVASQVAMLLLTGEKGDWCIRSDLGTVWIITANNGHLLTDWTQLAYPATPVHQIGGGTHSADTIADIQTKVSDGSLITSAADEYSSFPSMLHPNFADLLLAEAVFDVGTKKILTLETLLTVGVFYRPAISIFDNTAGLPVAPVDGDRYIAKVTAHGWIADNYYKWDSSIPDWVEYYPVKGIICFVTAMNTYYLYDGTGWFALLRMDKIVPDDSAFITVTPVADTLELGFDDHGRYTIYEFWLYPVISIYDNTAGLPVLPTVGDRYIAKVTAHGWTKDHIYDWDNAVWGDFTPSIGSVVKDKALKILWHYDGANWILEAYMPSSDQKAALAGTSGTPSSINKYVTDADSRNTNSRTPTAHDLAGALHNADTITNLNLKLSDGDVLSTKAGEINALTVKGTPTTSDLLLIEDAADSNNKKKITIATLPAAAPAAHLIGGAAHTADTIANIQSKVSDGSLITSKAAEISTLTEKTTPIGADLVLIEDSAAANAKKKVQISNIFFPRYLFYADQFLSPNNADWPINALAPAGADSLNNAIINRIFDDGVVTAETGVGFFMELPSSAIGINIFIRGRGQSAGGGGVVHRIYTRQISNNAAVGAWSAATALTTLTVPANTNFQFYNQAISFVTLGLTAGNIVQFEFTRQGSAGADTLVGNWNLLELRIMLY